MSQPGRMLTQTEREFYFDEGYLVKKAIISEDWLTKLNNSIDKLVEKSRIKKS